MRIFPLALLAGLASTGAYAADVVEEAPPAPVVQEAPIFSWTGGYIGIQGGGLWSHSSFNESDTGLFSDNFNGGLLGGYAGYNYQAGAWVFGIEGDFNGVWNDETFNVGGFDVDIGTDYLASVRGRVGYAIDRTSALRHRWRGVYPDVRRCRPLQRCQSEREQKLYRLDGRSWRRIRLYQQLDRPPRVPFL